MSDFIEELKADDIEDFASMMVKVECSFCSEEVEAEALLHEMNPMAELTQQLNDLGWRNLDSDEFMQLGVSCPSCIKQEARFRADANMDAILNTEVK